MLTMAAAFANELKAIFYADELRRRVSSINLLKGYNFTIDLYLCVFHFVSIFVIH